MELYRDSLIELDRIILGAEHWGPVMVAGDFNAHLGPSCSPRAHMKPNAQGVLFAEVLNRCTLHATSLGEAVSGPNYTYHSGNFMTTVDYIFADIEASACVEHCYVHEDTDLNSSDHLPLSVTLSCTISTQFAKDPDWVRIDWAKAGESEAMLSFQRKVSERLQPYIQRSKGNIDHINREIEHVAWLITNAAQKTLPLLKPKKAHRFRDRTLSQLCVESKKAWRVWCEEGRPPTGPLYDAKCSLRREVRQQIKFCAVVKERKQIQRR